MPVNAGSFAASPLRYYLAAIGEVPLLSAAEERELAARIATGDAEARDRLVRANLPLVVHLARGYRDRGLPPEDLIAEGNLGLIRAAEGFDASAGVRFNTYACYWIRHAIRSALMKQGTAIRLPAHLVKAVVRWRRAERELARELGRAPTPEEIGRELGLGRDKVRRIVGALRLLEVLGRGLDSPEEEASAAEGVADGRGLSAEERAIAAEDAEGLRRLLAGLDEREVTIIRERFGLDGGVPKTLAELGRQLGGYSRERVRQLEARVLAKLRAAAV